MPTPASRLGRFLGLHVGLRFAGLVFLATALFSCGGEIASPCAAAGGPGQEIPRSSRDISRIVSLAPSATEILFAIDAGDRVVGVDDFSTYPPDTSRIEKVGSLNPDVERIVALSPDLVVAANITDPRVIERLEATGILVWIADSPDVCGVPVSIRSLGEAIGLSGQAEKVAGRLEERIDEIVEAVAGAVRPRVFHELDASDPTKPFTVGPGNFVHDLITLAGGENIFADAASPFPQVSFEEVLARDPEVIILADAPFGVSADAVVARTGWSAITAVSNGKILELSVELADQIARPGPRIADGLEAVARFLHPGRFP